MNADATIEDEATDEDSAPLGPDLEETVKVGLAEIEKKDMESRIQTRDALVEQLFPYFKYTLFTVLGIIATAFFSDILLVYTWDKFMPEDRVVTSSIVATLIGATAVQLGAVFYLCGAWVFKDYKERKT